MCQPFHIVTILVTKLSPVQLQATVEGNIAPAKKDKRAQFLLLLGIIIITRPEFANLISLHCFFY